MTLNHDSAREEVNRQEAEAKFQAELDRDLRNAAAFGKMMDAIFAPLDKAIDQEKARREVDEVDPHT
jgi:hypothetical protein